MPEKRHTTTEAAALFGVSRLTVYRWIHAGKLKAGRYGGTMARNGGRDHPPKSRQGERLNVS